MRFNLGHLIVALVFAILMIIGLIGWKFNNTIGYVWFSGTTLVAVRELYMFFKDDGINPRDIE